MPETNDIMVSVNNVAMDYAVKAFGDLPLDITFDGEMLKEALNVLYSRFDLIMADGVTRGIQAAGEAAKVEIERVRWQSYEDGRQLGFEEGYGRAVLDAEVPAEDTAAFEPLATRDIEGDIEHLDDVPVQMELFETDVVGREYPAQADASHAYALPEMATQAPR